LVITERRAATGLVVNLVFRDPSAAALPQDDKSGESKEISHKKNLLAFALSRFIHHLSLKIADWGLARHVPTITEYCAVGARRAVPLRIIRDSGLSVQPPCPR
jgi:hypothetical protein